MENRLIKMLNLQKALKNLNNEKLEEKKENIKEKISTYITKPLVIQVKTLQD